MSNTLQARIDALRTFRVNARRNIERAQFGISDDIDRRRFIEIQRMVLQGTEKEWQELHAITGQTLPGSVRVRLLPPGQRRLPTVRSSSKRTLNLPTMVIKSVDTEERVLTGWASISAIDRVGDVVRPEGATYKLPLPLLLDHEHSAQVGHVIKAKPDKNGIRFTAQISRVEEPGPVQQMVDRAWTLVKHRLRSSVSIGFLPLKSEPLNPKEPYGGVRFLKWQWLELSLVSVPAQAGAEITGFKGAA